MGVRQEVNDFVLDVGPWETSSAILHSHYSTKSMKSRQPEDGHQTVHKTIVFTSNMPSGEGRALSKKTKQKWNEKIKQVLFISWFVPILHVSSPVLDHLSLKSWIFLTMLIILQRGLKRGRSRLGLTVDGAVTRLTVPDMLEGDQIAVSEVHFQFSWCI